MTFSIIIPVLHEGESILSLIDDIRALRPEIPHEIIVVDGGPESDTLEALRERKDVIRLVSPPGRARQMNKGADMAGGEVLLFLHADTRLPPGALGKIRETLGGSDAVGGAFDLGIASGKTSFKFIGRAASLRSRLTRIPYGDQAIFVKKEYFILIGGYRDIPLMEDVDLMQRIKKRGGRIRILKDRVLTSTRRWDKEGILFCTLRNWILSTLYYLGVSPDRLNRFYRQGKDAYGS
ncbi:MAG TPA: TIGR04283 family arsenosugar biosynthesis glycosyltransferase [Syntrophales bacterium]|nr:TIGR04283 family arsenosugar biosynthesis glycosyltransferase [Syntrophales bacterium]HOX93187.1 TIGR04283 family arsenosugar biosynthesis glycosyltransferase [Syntrophales bacterium]HPI57635.1 TIGR04283 family arsenosugar biosynthesis glycosyltransferase [Syntrophales bacterium]HPN25352.1 TIGR04283 family arsenosugar biosynthesis glycosyltransferase [Syntrophales bacterium]HQM29644.1 TIGR04283 family arsenosugar biosynthesis glycosyltransferase [Syntrophales bacterium]